MNYIADYKLLISVLGPKLYVKPSTKSNKTIINNAISHCCLAGSVNTTMKNKVLEVLHFFSANLKLKDTMKPDLIVTSFFVWVRVMVVFSGFLHQ